MNTQHIRSINAIGQMKTAPLPRYVTKLLLFVGGAVLLGLTWWYLDYVFAAISATENIRDSRSDQVSTALKYWFGAVLIVGTGLVLYRSRQVVKSLETVRLFVSGMSGLSIGTIVVGSVLLGVAQSTIVVTPPAAWLIVTLAGALFGLAFMQTLGRSRR